MFVQDIQYKASRNSVGDALLRALAVTPSDEVVIKDIFIDDMNLPDTYDATFSNLMEQLYTLLDTSVPVQYGKVLPGNNSSSDKPLASLYVVDRTDSTSRIFVHLCAKRPQDTIGTIQYRENRFVTFIVGRWGNSSELHYKRFLHPTTHEPFWFSTHSFNNGRVLVRSDMSVDFREGKESDLHWYPCSKHTIRSAFKYVLGPTIGGLYGNIWTSLIVPVLNLNDSDTNVPDKTAIRVGKSLNSLFLTLDDVSKPLTTEYVNKLGANIGTIVAALLDNDPFRWWPYYQEKLRKHFDV